MQVVECGCEIEVLQNIDQAVDSSNLSLTMAAAAVALPVGQPDISYAPDSEKFAARTRRRYETEQLEKVLPAGFPKKLVSDLVWEGQDLVGKYDWTYQLNDEEVGEIEAALQYFQGMSRSQQIFWVSLNLNFPSIKQTLGFH
jgi:hypothetical protein